MFLRLLFFICIFGYAAVFCFFLRGETKLLFYWGGGRGSSVAKLLVVFCCFFLAIVANAMAVCVSVAEEGMFCAFFLFGL